MTVRKISKKKQNKIINYIDYIFRKEDEAPEKG